MKKFLKDIVLFLVYFIPVMAISLGIFIFMAGLQYIPPPRISDSLSLNDKLFYSIKRNADNITIGSSMSLNNICSGEIIKFTGSDSYFNFGNWGMRIEDDLALLQEYAKIKTPKAVFMASSIGDFQKKEIIYNSSDISKMLNTEHPYLYYFKYPNVKYYINNQSYYEWLKSVDTLYETLKYDHYGQVCYPVNRIIKLPHRWNEIITNDLIDDNNYRYLDSLACFSKKNGIALYFMESPVRQGMLNVIDQKAIEKHINRISAILGKYNQVFINGYEKIWPDSLYVDATHLDANGARVFTAYCIEKIKEKSTVPAPEKKSSN